MSPRQARPLLHSLLFLCLTAPLSATEDVATISPEIRDLIRESTQPAVAEPFHTADLGSRVTGYVQAVPVDIGDRVKKGDPLVIISVPDLVQRERSAEADARESSTAVTAASSDLEAVEVEVKRVLSLVDTGSVTSKLGDESRQRLAAAQARLAAAEAAFESAEARTAEATAMLDFATIRAPFDGLVVQRSVDPGDLVTAAGPGHLTPLLRVARTDILRVVVHLPEADAVWLDSGDSAVVHFDALSGKSFTAPVARLSGSLEPQSQRMRAEIDLPNADGKHPAGLYGRATITLEKRPGALVIPPDAVRLGGESPIVYIIENGRVRHQAVELGLDQGDVIEVLSGLAAEDRIAAGRIGRLADGAEVTSR